jgi:hypothetical protein
MIPTDLTALVLVLAAYRIVRLIGWDDFPPIQRFRDWVTGARFVATSGPNAGYTQEQPAHAWVYQRPLLAHFLGCAFCVGAWISAAVYVCWLEWPRPTLYGAAPFALSAAVGLIAKNLDA